MSGSPPASNKVITDVAGVDARVLPAILESDITPENLLSEDQLRHLDECGFVTVECIASRSETAHIRHVIEKLFAARSGYEQGSRFNSRGAENARAAASISQIVAPHNYAAILRWTDFYDRAWAIARQVLGPRARFAGDHILLKPALDGPETPWHQDEAYRISGRREISIWMPLQPVDHVNGCMSFIPGTHLGPILPHRSPGNDPHSRGLECCGGFDVESAVACPLPAGGAVIHTGRTIHSAGPNRSNASRYAYMLNFSTPGAPAWDGGNHPWLEEKDTARRERLRKWLERENVVVDSWREGVQPCERRSFLSRLLRRSTHN